MKLALETSEYRLEIEGSRFKLRQYTGPKNQDAWINGRQGDLQHSTISTTARNGRATVYFDGRNIGTIPASDHKNIDSLAEIVEYYNASLGPTDLQTARTALLLSQGREIVDKTTSISTFTLTWNMCGSLAKLSRAQVNELVDYSCQVLVLNFQETDALNRNLVANQQTLASTIEKFSRPSHTLISSVQLLGLMTLVLVRSDLKVSNIRNDSSGVGFLRVWGNKGAVLSQFTLLNDQILGGGAEFVVVNCHLSAGDKPEQNSRRRWELREISKKFGINNVISADETTEFDPAAYEFDADEISDLSDEDSQTPARYRKNLPGEPSEQEKHGEIISEPSESSEIDEPPHDGIDDLDKPQVPEKDYADAKPLPALPTEETNALPQFIIFTGDFNYRVTGDPQSVVDLATNGKFATILENDHCTRLVKEKKIFVDFYEHPITFKPTYKHKPGSTQYDSAQRTPSYTDRTFYGGDLKFEIKRYATIPLTISDHHPVISTGVVEFISADWDQYTRLVDKSYRMVDKAENLAIPNLLVEPNSISEKSAIFSIPCESVKLVSQSSRPVEWKAAPNEMVQIAPTSGIIEPNSSQRIAVKSFLGVNTSSVNEIMVINVEGGADRFISVIFEKLPTLLGLPLSKLEKKEKLPACIVECVEYLWSRVVPEIFTSQGELSIIQQVMEWLDKPTPLDIEVLDTANSTSHGAGSTSVARVIYLIVTNLPEPLLVLENTDIQLTQEYIQETLPQPSADLVIYLVKFFRHIKDFGCPIGSLVLPLENMLMGRETSREREQLIERLLTDEDW